MRGRGLAPNARSYNAALSACARGGDWRTADALLEDMVAIRVRVRVGLTIRGGLGLANPNPNPNQVAGGVPPTAVSLNAAIFAAAVGGEWRRALALL